jgi:hypothetical protein
MKTSLLSFILLILFIISSQIKAKESINFVPVGSEWSYSDSGIDLGKEWIEPDFDDSAWKKR